MADDFWKQKLMAFLHDPPCKPLDIAAHETVGEGFIRQAGIDLSDMAAFHKICDWTAAAADRFPFPAPSVLRSSFEGTAETPFHHPLGQSEYIFGSRFPSPAAAEEVLQIIQNGLAADQVPEQDRTWANFFLHWRRWPIESARQDARTYFLPADTRIPDHNVWTHNSVVSALQGCVRNGRLEPAFLIFQMGPVQTFIEQARSTRDLWSGSYILSWLVAHAIKAVTDEVGPDALIFPALRAQPLFDLLHRDRLYSRIKFSSQKGTEESLWDRMRLFHEIILTPNLPNRFLAVVPEWIAANLARKAEAAVHEELGRIADACWCWLHDRLPMELAWKQRFDSQVKVFPQITWQCCPWGSAPVADNLREFARLCPAPESPADRLKVVYDLATQDVPPADRDKRYFSDQDKTQLKNPGFCWPYFYAQTDWLLAARRNTRDFKAWVADPSQAGVVKDSFSGVEEVIGSESWWKSVQNKLPMLFRSQDRLGAMNLIKRVWHQAYLSGVWNLEIDHAVRFESVPGVAAGKWRQQLEAQVKNDAAIYQKIVRVRAASINLTTKDRIKSSKSSQLEDWLAGTDPDQFTTTYWTDPEFGNEESTVKEIIAALRDLYNRKSGTAISSPPAYYAVIAFDGDEMGKWLSGEKAPPLLEQFSSEAAAYFQAHARDKSTSAHRPLSPSYHLQFSEALANFGLYLARPVVEHFAGQLIYSGGDDVLAMVPAGAALDCAAALHAAFRGDPRLADLVEDAFEICGSKGGFIRLKNPQGEQPTWPLIVPGPGAQASAGIAVGHVHAPLQNMIRVAREAEKRAKNKYGRAACAVSLYKRSGEILEWGFKWETDAPDLYRLFSMLSQGEAPLLPGRFGYAVSELLAPYHCGNGTYLSDAEEFPTKKIMEREFGHVLRRQGMNLKKKSPKQYEQLKLLSERYIGQIVADVHTCLSDFPMLFNVANFINRGEE